MKTMIITLKGKDIQLNDEEFEKKCAEALELEKTNKNATPTPC